jgi:hypothetical protein
MADSTRLGVAILLMFLAMVCFFFAFHPGGVQGVSDPDTMLQWLMGEFNTASADPGAKLWQTHRVRRDRPRELSEGLLELEVLLSRHAYLICAG